MMEVMTLKAKDNCHAELKDSTMSSTDSQEEPEDSVEQEMVRPKSLRLPVLALSLVGIAIVLAVVCLDRAPFATDMSVNGSFNSIDIVGSQGGTMGKDSSSDEHVDHRRKLIGITQSDALTMANLIAGPGVTVISAFFNVGTAAQFGTFSNGDNSIFLDSGIVLSTGNVSSLTSPSNGLASTSFGGVGYAALNNLLPTGGASGTFDAAVLTIEFECAVPEDFSFEYVFGSEEYEIFTNNGFNDVFGFFFNGEAVSNNIARLPNGAPVSIDNVNCGNPFNPFHVGDFCDYLIDNSDGQENVNLYAYTVPLYVESQPQPGNNSITIGIEDEGDGLFDSAVFIRTNSLQCKSPPEPKPSPVPGLLYNGLNPRDRNNNNRNNNNGNRPTIRGCTNRVHNHCRCSSNNQCIRQSVRDDCSRTGTNFINQVIQRFRQECNRRDLRQNEPNSVLT